MDRDLPVSDVLTMNQLLGKSTLDQSFNTALLVAFATVSLVLAAVGLFGVMSYIAAQRTTEIGIRVALGAKREQVMRKMLLDGIRPAVFGLVVGLAASLEAGQLMRDLLYEIKPLDPAVYAAVAATLLAVAAFACIVPAWRAIGLRSGRSPGGTLSWGKIAESLTERSNGGSVRMHSWARRAIRKLLARSRLRRNRKTDLLQERFWITSGQRQTGSC
jgi:hypothetical protein